MSNWIEQLAGQLAEQPRCGYYDGQAWATEPTSLAALALMDQGRVEAAWTATDSLAEIQNADGSVGVNAALSSPGWPTGLATIAWLAADQAALGRGDSPRYADVIDRAVHWICRARGETLDPGRVFGHDATLVGWPWVLGTHSWIEPTALQLLALKSTGHSDHPRAREAVRLLLDRQLPGGGCNYGNTRVWNRVLRPHVQPTGIAMLALAGEPGGGTRVDKALAYLQRQPRKETPIASQAWALLALAAHGRYPATARSDLQAAWWRGVQQDQSPYKRALLAIAAAGQQARLVCLPRCSSKPPHGLVRT